jgi:ABC-2 type transport system ATP-binding protein
MSLLALQALTKRYGPRRGVDSLSLAIPEGSLFGFLGPNGAGKTTAIRVLMGLLRPTSGSASIFGLDCWRDGARIKADVGYVPGDLRLYPWLTGLAALRLFGRVRGRDLVGEGRAMAEEIDLDLGVVVRKMSRGTRQKLGLVLAMAHRPRVLILDEPTSGLDPLIQDRLRARLKRMAGGGCTVFFSSHTLGEVDELCDRVAILREGRLVAEGTLAELRSKAGHEVVIRWSGGAGVGEAPAFLKLDVRAAEVWEGMLDGPVSRLIEWLAGRPVEDLSVGRPDLEALFRRYYGGESASGRQGGSGRAP